MLYRSYQQSWLARRILARQALVAYVASNQRLLQALDVPGLTVQARPQTAGQSELRYGMLWQERVPLTSPVFRPSFMDLAKGEDEVAPLQDELVDTPTQHVADVDSEYPLVDVPGQVKSVSADQLIQDEPEDASTQRVADVSSENLLVDVPGVVKSVSAGKPLESRGIETDRPDEVKFQKEQEETNVHTQPMESAKTIHRPRGQIEEILPDTGQAPPSLPRSPIQPAQRDDQAPKALERPTVDATEMSEEEKVADDLGAPRGTERSPQYWMALLTGTSSAVHDDVVSPSEQEEVGQEDKQLSAGIEQAHSPVKAEIRQDDRELPSMGSEQANPLKSSGYLKGAGPSTYPNKQHVEVPHADARSHSFRIWRDLGQAESGQQKAGGKRFVPGIMRDVSRAQPASEPLSQRTKQFLQPLLGVDPSNIRIHRDAIAERLTDAYQADAVAVGDDVELAAGHTDDIPETLGLLAHEFTHVVRQREPHFIPPIAHSTSTSPSRASWPSSTDDEKLAQQVESRVKRAAQNQVDQVTSIATEQIAHSSKVTSPAQVTRPTRDAWGGLPAPWEPLPDWLVTAPAMAESSTPAHVVTSQPLSDVYGVGGNPVIQLNAHQGDEGVMAGDTSGNSGVQRAGKERSLDGEEEQTETSQPAATRVPEPNMDELARQVYTLLKRRLDAERRRES